MRLHRLLLPLLALSLIAAAKKQPLTIRFHTESNPQSGAPFTVTTNAFNAEQPLTLSKIADISEQDIVAIYPFQASNGTLGCAFKLNSHGALSLDTLSQQNRGTIIVGFVNARPVIAMQIDQRVSDGILTISQGLLPQEVALMRNQFPVLGEKKKLEKGKASAKSNTTPGMTPIPSPIRPNLPAPRGD